MMHVKVCVAFVMMFYPALDSASDKQYVSTWNDMLGYL